MSTAVAQARVRRLANLGLLGASCTPTERITQLRSRTEEIDDRTFRRLEAFFSALGDTTRLRILKLMNNEELCSCEVMAALELTQPTTSHHLGILERACLLRSRRKGKWVFYRIASSKIQALISRSQSQIEEAD